MNNTSPMTSATYQTQLTDETYNGWSNYGVKWYDDDLNICELNEMLEDL